VSAILDALYHGRRDEAARLARQDSLSLSIHEAAAMGVLPRVQALVDEDPSEVNAFAPDGFQPLGLAAFFGHTQVAELLVARGADPNTPSRNAQGVNALHAALAGPTPELASALLNAGADPNARQQSGVTPLHEAAHIGRADLVRLLIEHGADVDARDDKGRNAADFAREGGHTSVLGALG
jgi:ankyrin repeat protein